MDRLADLVIDLQGEVDVELQFGKEGRVPTISGTVGTLLKLECQCCLEPLLWPIHGEVKLGVVGSVDEALSLPDSLEPLLVAVGAEVLLLDIVQDELLLALPCIPQHSYCQPQLPPEAVKERPHPFAALATLKIDLPSDED
jgi:uncharacterized protein